jgi:hypothetical protein
MDKSLHRKETMNKKYARFIPLIIIFLLMVSCTAKQSTGTETEAYPVQGETAYPVTVPNIETQSGYPITKNTPEYKQGPEFHIDVPLKTGDMVVTGTGPADVPINLIDVSEVGFLLGETVIAEDGTFSFSLTEPLKTGHLIGIQLGDIEGTDLNEEDFLYSDTYYERPLVGILFDLVVVE